MTEAEKEIGRCYAAGFEDEGWGHEPRNAGILTKLEKAKKEPPEKIEPCQHLDFTTSDLRYYKMINLCCFKPLNL